MKKIIIYVLILIAVLLVPVERTDVGKLRPVQSVAIYGVDGVVIIETDTGDRGEGENAVAALEDLKRTTPAVIYLDTAEYLLVNEDMEGAVEHLRAYLKETVELYHYVGTPKLEDVTQYLEIHGNAPVLKEWRRGKELPILDCREERVKIM